MLTLQAKKLRFFYYFFGSFFLEETTYLNNKIIVLTIPYLKKKKSSRAWWCTPITTATQETEGWLVQGKSQQLRRVLSSLARPCFKEKKKKKRIGTALAQYV